MSILDISKEKKGKGKQKKGKEKEMKKERKRKEERKEKKIEKGKKVKNIKVLLIKGLRSQSWTFLSLDSIKNFFDNEKYLSLPASCSS